MFIEFNNVSMTYKPGIHALKNVSFRIEKGEFVFIIGRSGSGKSTIVKLLTCEERATSGNIFLENYDITDISRRDVTYLRRNIGMIFQDFRLIQSKTVYQNVAFAMEIIGFGRSVIRKRVPMVLSIVGLRNKANMYPNQLSGGEQQRVAIARAMVNGAALILADEPTGNLDPINSEAVMALLQEINDSGTTVVVCTHDATMVNKLRQRVIEISGGRLVRDEKLGEYNLSCEIKKSKGAGSDTTERAVRGRPAGDRHGNSAESPFVRNVKLKLSDFELVSEDELASVITEEKSEEEEQIMALVDKASEASKDASQQEDAYDRSSPDNSAEEALRIAVEYYMRKARKYQDIETECVPEDSKPDIEPDPEKVTVQDPEIGEPGLDFINLIKPRRIRSDDKTERRK